MKVGMLQVKTFPAVQLDLYSNGGNIAAHVYNYAEEIEEAIVTAYAEALAGAANYYDTNSCWAYADSNVCIYGTNPPKCAGCTASAVSDTYTEEIDAIATAGVPLPPLHKLLLLCSGSQQAQNTAV